MIEKVLILSRYEDFLAKLQERLKKYGVEVVDTFTGTHQVQLDELRHRYNIIVVDKLFLDNAENTAEFIRTIRERGFLDPIIAFGYEPYGGRAITLLAAGCNFWIEERGRQMPQFATEICLLIGEISQERLVRT